MSPSGLHLLSGLSKKLAYELSRATDMSLTTSIMLQYNPLVFQHNKYLNPCYVSDFLSGDLLHGYIPLLRNKNVVHQEGCVVVEPRKSTSLGTSDGYFSSNQALLVGFRVFSKVQPVNPIQKLWIAFKVSFFSV